jgi:hypothetical protein
VATSRGRRARLRLRTLVRWLNYFETTPVSPDEMLLRRVPNFENYFFFEESTRTLAVAMDAFKPRANRDPDGMSFYREDFTTSQEVASDTTLEVGARVVRISVQKLTQLGITEIIPDPQPGPAGHVYIPALKYVNRNTLTKDEKRARDNISLSLAQHATKNGVWARPGLPDPARM